MTTVEAKAHVIAARDRGPGPAKYNLPSSLGFQAHDSTKRTNPAYSFGLRTGSGVFKKESNPGPQYFVEPKFTRHGRDGVPAYSMLGRRNLNQKQKSPGPGQYSPEQHVPPSHRNAPRYSMGTRNKYRKNDTNPSPNSYALPSTIGARVTTKHASAAYSMSGRGKAGGFSEDLAKTPGPGRYNSTPLESNRRKAPAFSIQSRHHGHEKTALPGPGAHSPEKVSVTKKAAPKFSIGIRHSEFVAPLIVEIMD